MRLQVLRSFSKVATLFLPYMNFIKAKRGDEEDQAKAAKSFMQWYHGNDPNDFEDMCREGFELEEKLQAAANKQRALESKGEEQMVFVDAADYADNWVKGGEDEFNVFYPSVQSGRSLGQLQHPDPEQVVGDAP